MARISTAERIQRALDTKNISGIYPELENIVGETSDVKEAVSRVAAQVGFKITPMTLRKVVRRGINSGRVKKDWNIYTLATRGRGRPCVEKEAEVA